MNRSVLRILAVDDELLIAMDVDHILRSALSCSVDVGGYAAVEERLSSTPPYDIVIFDTDVPLDELGRLVERARAAGTSVVFGSASDLYHDGVPGMEDVPVIPKPYESERMIETIRALSAER